MSERCSSLLSGSSAHTSSNGRQDCIDVCIIDDHPAISEAVQNTLAVTDDLTVSGWAMTVEQGFDMIRHESPDIAIIDISLSDGHGLDLVKQVKAQLPDVKTLVYSMYDEQVYAERAIRAGAMGYVMKTKPTERLKDVIRKVNEGKTVVSEEMATRVLGRIVSREHSDSGMPFDELTDRELEVVHLLGEGKSIGEIQAALNVARKTVETYRRRAKEKLGFDTVAHLVRWAMQLAQGRGRMN